MKKKSSQNVMTKLEKQLIATLNLALQHQVANLGGQVEFYRCYTYPSGELPQWVKVAKRLSKNLTPKAF